MRRYCYIKYALTLLMSIVLTFRFFPSRPSEDPGRKEFDDYSLDGNRLPARPVLKLPNNPGWRVLPGNVTVHVGDKFVPRNTSYLVNAEKICNTFDKSRLSLLVFVSSSNGNFARRQAIRDTWSLRALQVALNFRVVFILGQTDSPDQKLVIAESIRYGDIVQINVNETFRNLGHKSLSALQWSKNFCKEAGFIAKTDDDILLYVPNLIDALKSHQSHKNILLCHDNHMRKILRKNLLDTVPEHYRKYKVSEHELPGTFYPPYCSGMAYVFSSYVRDKLLDACLRIPTFFIEDVYITGFCRYKAGINITPFDGITLRPPIEPEQAKCVFRDGRITSQEVGVDELRHLWAELNTQGYFCPQLLGIVQNHLPQTPKKKLKLRSQRSKITISSTNDKTS